jgi:hypothetical protein
VRVQHILRIASHRTASQHAMAPPTYQLPHRPCCTGPHHSPRQCPPPPHEYSSGRREQRTMMFATVGCSSSLCASASWRLSSTLLLTAAAPCHARCGGMMRGHGDGGDMQRMRGIPSAYRPPHGISALHVRTTCALTHRGHELCDALFNRIAHAQAARELREAPPPQAST